MAQSAARRRYDHQVLGLSAAYVGTLFGVEALFHGNPPSGLVAYAAAVLPALPIIGIFVAIGRYLVTEHDEYLRMLMARQALIATGFALSVATIWGFLENFDLVRHVDAYFIAILWFAGMGIGACITKLGDGRDA